MFFSFKPIIIRTLCTFTLLALPEFASADVKVDQIHFSADGSLLGSANKLVKNQGDWSAVQTYSVNDAVQYLGVRYICIAPNTNIMPPTDPASWATFSAQGAFTCTDTANTSLTVVAGGTGNAVAPACPTGYIQTSTNCESSSWKMPFVYVRNGICSAQNNDTNAQDLRASRTCCKVQ